MKKIFTLLVALLFPFFAYSQQDAIIIDHTCIDLSDIPENWIDSAKQNLYIGYGHTSHGSQLTAGMNALESYYTDGSYDWSHSGGPGELHLYEGDGYGDGDLDHDCGYAGWEDETSEYLDAHPDCNVIIWSWCGQVNSVDLQTHYLQPMEQLESDYPDVTFVYMTGHLEGLGPSGSLYQANQEIRNYCNNNNKILFDFADIEKYTPDADTNFQQYNADDQCRYDHPEGGTRNWANDWLGGHPGHLLTAISQECGSCAHSVSLNCVKKGIACWFLWARIAGWSGSSEPPTRSIATGTIVGSPFCAGEYIDVPFTIEGSFNSGNYFIAQLSDASGDFSSPLVLDSLLGTSSDTIEDVKLPDSLSGCSGYRIRVVSDAPAVVGSDNGSDIAINPLPEPQITSGSVQVCENDEYMYIRETDVGSDFKWKAEGGVIVGDDVGDTVTVAWNGMGVGKLTLVQTSASGCIDSTELDVTINALPEPEITSGEASVCAYHEESYACNSSAELEIQWKAVGGEIVGADTNSSVTILWGAAGSATLTLIQTDRDAGCRDSLKQAVTINSSPEAEILSGDSVVCEEDEATYSGRSDPSIEYQWSVAGGTIDGDADNASVIVLWEAPGSGTITLVMSDGDTGCRDTTHKSVTINPLPSVSFACSTDEICENEGDFELGGGSPEGGRYTGAGVISGRFYPARTGAGTFEITYTYEDNGCENSASDSVIVHSTPEKPTIEERNDTLFSSPAESYQWYYNEERIVSAAGRFLVPDGSGHYAVEITDAHSCSNMSDNYYYEKTSVDMQDEDKFNLVARPNPFTGETTVYFTLENGSRVSARLIDIMGKEAVNIINSEYMERGANKIDFEAKNMLPGVYYLVLQAGASTETIKLIIIK